MKIISFCFQGVSGFLFAFLPYCKTTSSFIGLSYLLRFLEGLGTSMAWSSALGILMQIFPGRVAKIMSWTQTCFGLGYMLGRITLSFVEEKTKKTKVIQNFMENHILFYHFPEKTC